MLHQIFGDKWETAINREWRIEEASTSDLDRVLDRLDARIYSMVTVCGIGEQHLAVGGGQGKYVVFQTDDNFDFWNLINPNASEGRVSINIGGQTGEYPARQVVGLEAARAAAHEYFRNGSRSSSLSWEKQKFPT